jgi:hypothetical protein
VSRVRENRMHAGLFTAVGYGGSEKSSEVHIT